MRARAARNRFGSGVTAALALLVLAGCTSGGSTSPQTTVPTTSTVSMTSTSESETSKSEAETTSSELTEMSVPDVVIPSEASALPLPSDQVEVQAASEQEAKDRADIEAVWRQVWELVTSIQDLPATDRSAQLDRVLTGTLKTQILDGTAANEEAGHQLWGKPILHPYWYQAVASKDYAVIGDCIDESEFGTSVTASGEHIKTGVKSRSTVGHFIRVPERGWILFQVTYLKGQTCEPSS